MMNLERGSESESDQQNSAPLILAPSRLSEHATSEGGALNEADPESTHGKNDEAVMRGLSILEEMSSGLSPTEMRSLSQSLLKLADAMDQDWSPASSRTRYHWVTRAGRIERNAIELAKTAIRIQELGRRRERYIPAEMLGEPSWQMLLELFIQFAGGAKVSTKSLCIISGCPDTTALRQIDQLEAAGLAKRSQSQEDKRVTLVELTREGVIAVGSALNDIES